MNLLINNKKGQFASVLIAVITIFIVAVILFFLNHVNERLYGALEDNFEDNPKLNNTQADIALDKINEIPVHTLEDFRAAIQKSVDSGYLTIEAKSNLITPSDDLFVALPIDKVLEEELVNAEHYHYKISPTIENVIECYSNKQ